MKTLPLIALALMVLQACGGNSAPAEEQAAGQAAVKVMAGEAMPVVVTYLLADDETTTVMGYLDSAVFAAMAEEVERPGLITLTRCAVMKGSKFISLKELAGAQGYDNSLSINRSRIVTIAPLNHEFAGKLTDLYQ
jgi:hypothetical protein